MEPERNEARDIKTRKDPFMEEVLTMHGGMATRYDPADLFRKLGRLRGFRRYISAGRTDYSHFLANSDWMASGIFTVGLDGNGVTSNPGPRKAGLHGSALFRHSRWTTEGAFTVRT